MMKGSNIRIARMDCCQPVPLYVTRGRRQEFDDGSPVSNGDLLLVLSVRELTVEVMTPSGAIGVLASSLTAQLEEP